MIMKLKKNGYNFKFPEGLSKGQIGSKNDDKCVIVSIVGKSDLISQGFKSVPVQHLLGKTVFQSFETIELNDACQAVINGYFDAQHNVCYLHLISTSDSFCLDKIWEENEKNMDEKGFLSVWADMKCVHSKALLFLFCISHIMIFHHPSCCFDMTYVPLFRTLDSVRQKALPAVSELLRNIPNMPKDWSSHGRLCSPRVLFYFKKCPSHLSDSVVQKSMEGINDSEPFLHGHSRNANKHPVKHLEHALEDQIYRILRKSRVITNISANSLFAIPANQEFVYVETSTNNEHISTTGLINQLIKFCTPSGNESDSSSCIKSQNPSSITLSLSSQSSATNLSCVPDRVWTVDRDPYDHNFKIFLGQHIDLAFSKGFDDNVGRHPGQSFFEVPSLGLWNQVATRLHQFFLTEVHDKEYKSRQAFSALKNLIDTDVKFSEGRCGKVLPLAIAAYQEGLPTHYTSEYHLTKMSHAISTFSLHARGPAFDKYVDQLKEECCRYWKNGHQMCEVLSLTGNHCINPVHRVLDDDTCADLKIPVMPHSSSIKYMSTTCNCGRKQSPRDDPFDVRAANEEFYSKMMEKCCGTLERIDFPVFKPSIKDYKAAQLITTLPDAQEKRCSSYESHRDVSQSSSIEASSSSNSMSIHEGADKLSPPMESQFQGDLGESGKSPVDESISITSTGPNKQCDSEDDDPVVMDETAVVSGGENGEEESSPVTHEKDLVSEMEPSDILMYTSELSLARQPSTTEYLPGMLHSESPPGLLPRFSSWSLVCLGPSSLYSHSVGIHDQPGFIHGTNFLLPWDVTIKVENKDKWPAIAESMGKKGMYLKHKKGKDLSEFYVKIFIGVEYECPRGHRFMCSGPDKVLKATGSGLVKDNASKITSQDMPLYFPCPCRANNPWIAQLMRVHVVTPKAPVHVTLLPKIQPAPPPCPQFLTGLQEPARLSQSAYWVLRFPYVYYGPQGSYTLPKTGDVHGFGKLVKGMYGITEVELSK